MMSDKSMSAVSLLTLRNVHIDDWVTVLLYQNAAGNRGRQ